MKKEAKESKEAKETKKSGNKKNDIVDAALPDSDASVEDKTLDNDGKVGTMLRETRLKRGEELVDIARKLCIRRVHLQAIEDSNYAEIPEAPYGQGFVRSYADYLGLNSIRMAQLFKEETEANSHKGDLHMLEPQAEASVPNYKYIIMSMVAIAAIYVGWVYYNAPLAEEQQLLEESLTTEVDTPEEDYPLQVEEFEEGSPSYENQSAPASTSKEEVKAKSEAPAKDKTADKASEAPAADAEQSPSSLAKEDNKAATNASPSVEKASASPKVDAPQPAAEAEPKTDTVVPSTSKVVMKVVKEAWIEAKSPTTLYISKVVEPGFVYNVPDEPGMTISAGRVDAVEVYVNGNLIKEVFTANKKTGISVDNLLENTDN